MEKKHLIAGIIILILLPIAYLILPTYTSPTNRSCATDYDCIYTCDGCKVKGLLTKEDKCSQRGLCKCIGSECIFNLNENYIKGITGIKKGNISFALEENVSKCDGCKIWHVEIKSNSTTVAIDFDANTGAMISSQINGIPTIISNCRYRYEEITPEYEFIMINPDCNNPKPFCDQTLEVCRRCRNDTECLRENISTYVPLDIGIVFTRYSILAIGTDINASYDEQSKICNIYANESIIYTNITTIDICRQTLLNFINCTNGVCSGAG